MRFGRHAIPSTLAAACIVGGLLAGALRAEITPPANADNATASTASASLQSVDGKVLSTSATRLVIATDAGNRLTFDLDAATATPASLAAGDRVSVRYSALAGANHADAVTLAAAAPSATAATNSSAVEPSAATAATPGDLPRTASSLPLVLLVGTLAALVAYGVHLSRERL